MTAFTALSRLTGFVRIVVVTGVLGTTALGNTYESANSVPNLLFELVAAGALQAVLIPTLVEYLDRGDADEADRVAGSVLGITATLLAALAAVVALAAPMLLRILFSGVSDSTLRAEQVRLGTVFLWFFLPQVVFYAVGTVATAVLNARHRFALPTAAPLVNNLVVTAAYLTFLYLRDGAPPSLTLSPLQVVVLAGGTTLGVVAFCAVPLVAARRLGFTLRPRFEHRHPAVRNVLRRGSWAVLELACTQVLLGVVLVLANRVEGGVVAYQAAYSYFLLPHALFALPVATALFPILARGVLQGDDEGVARHAQQGLRALAYILMPAAAALAVLGPLLARTMLVGHVHNGGVQMVGSTIVAFGPGLVGFGVFVFAGRLLYSRGNTRVPAICNLVVVVLTSAAMVLVATRAASGDVVPGLAWAQTSGYTLGAAALWWIAVRDLPRGSRSAALPTVAVCGLGGLAAAAVMAAVVRVGPWDGRVGGLLGLASAGALGVLAYASLVALLGGPRPRSLWRLLRGGSAL